MKRRPIQKPATLPRMILINKLSTKTTPIIKANRMAISAINNAIAISVCFSANGSIQPRITFLLGIGRPSGIG
jgi:hypothetical protein